MSRLVFSGLFDRWPIRDHHPSHGRDDSVLRRPGRLRLGPVRYAEFGLGRAKKPKLNRRVFDYFKMFHADTALFGAAGGYGRRGLSFLRR